MPQYDGSVRFNTEINIKSAEAQLGTLSLSIIKTAKSISDLQTKLDSLKTVQIPTQEYTEISTQIEKAQRSLVGLLEKQEQMKAEGKDSGASWERISNKIADTRNEINFAKGELQDLVDSGKAFTIGDPAQEEKLTQQIQAEEARLESMVEKRDLLNTKVQAAIEEEQRLAQIKENATVSDQKLVDLLEQRKQLLAQIRDMEKAGVTEGYAEYDKELGDLSNVQSQINGIRDMRDAAAEARASYVGLGDSVRQAFRTMAQGLIDIPIAAIKSGVNGLISGFRSLGNVAKNVVAKSFQILGNAIKTSLSKAGSLIGGMISGLKNLASAAKKSFGAVRDSANKSNGTIGLSLKNILKYGFGIRSLYALVNKIRSAIKEGFGNLYKDNERFQNSVDNLKASILTLKNAFAAAFRPIVEVAIPYIQMAADKLTELLNKVGQFTAAIAGQTSYTKAIKQTADAFKDAKKAAEGYLSPLDEINKFSTKKDETEQIGIMFEEVPIEQKFKDFANRLKDMWAKSDFSDLGKVLGEKLKSSLDNIPWNEIKEKAGKIGKSLASLINGFIGVDGLGYSIGKTLAEAFNTGFEFLNNFVHELNWESVGKFIAESINGLLNNIDWNLIYDTFVTVAKGLGDAINSFVDNLDWDAVSTTIANFVNTFVDTVYTFFTTVDWEELGKRIGETLTETIKKIDFEKVGKAIGSVIQAAIDFVKNFISELSFEDIVNAITDTIKGFFEEANWEDIAKIALSLLVGALIAQSSMLKFAAAALAILTAFQDELIALDWKKAGEVVGEYFIKFFDFIATTIENIDWWAVGEKVKEFLVNIDWNGVADAFFEAVGAAFGGFMAFLGGLLAEAVVDAVDYFRDKIEEAGGDVVEGILVGIAEALVGIGEWIKEHVFKPFMDGFKKAFEIHSPSKAMESIGQYIIEGLLNGLKNMWSSITSWIENKVGWIIDKFKGIKDKVSGFFSGGSGDSGQSNSGKSFSMRSMMSTYSTNPAFATLAAAPIPKLATGAVIPPNKEFLAVLGDQKSGTNIEAPLDTIKQANRESLMEVMSELGLFGGGGNDGNTYNVKAVANGKVIFEMIIEEGMKALISSGRNPFDLQTT